MYRFLIPLSLLLLATLAEAQAPYFVPLQRPGAGERSVACTSPSSAGTVRSVGPVRGKTLTIPSTDTLFLCLNDSTTITHAGDANLSGDPRPSTRGGIGYAIYKCTPTATGPDLLSIQRDACAWTPAEPRYGIWLLGAVSRTGTVKIKNDGSFVTDPNFGDGRPVVVTFAPITLDSISPNGRTGFFEAPTTGGAIGSCVNVGIASAFRVAYLTAINGVPRTIAGSDDCIGRFVVSGGYPQLDTRARYKINIALATNPNVKAQILTREGTFAHASEIVFGVTQAGTYRITIEDGKTCAYSFTMDMGTCNSSDNVQLLLPEVEAGPGTTVCIPVLTTGYTNVVGSNFSLSWDPTKLRYRSTNKTNRAFGQEVTLNTGETTAGRFGFVTNNISATGVTLSPRDTIFEICFDVIGTNNQCTPLRFTNRPAGIDVSTARGSLGVTLDTGQVCIKTVPLRTRITVRDSSCAGTATLRIFPSGGVPTYEVTTQRLPNGPVRTRVLTPGGLDSLLNVSRDTFRIRVRDGGGNGTNTFDTTVIINIPSLGASMNLTPPKCFGGRDGSISAVVSLSGAIVSNPGSDYRFQWSNNPAVPNPTGQTQTGVSRGSYSVTVTQVSRGCSVVSTNVLSEPQRLVRDSLRTVRPTCTGLNNGTIRLSASGGTPLTAGGYTFAWQVSSAQNSPRTPVTGTGTTTSVLSSRAEGFYFVTVTDANNCSFRDSLQLTSTKVVDLAAGTITQPTCFGGTNGAAQVRVTETPAGTPSTYTFTWNNGSRGTVTNTGTTSSLANAPAGAYRITARDAAGCTDTVTINIGTPARLVADTSVLRNPTCLRGNDGQISVIADGGTGRPNYTYRWSSRQQTSTITGLVPGTYTVTVVDVNNCRDSLTFNLRLPNPPTLQGIDSTSVKCGSDGCLTARATGASAFIWRTLAGDSIANTARVCNLRGNTYVVRIQDAQSCFRLDTVRLGSKNVLTFNDTTYTQPSCAGGATGNIGVVVGGGSPGYTYRWSAAGQTGAVANSLKAGSYTVTVTDRQNCTLTGSFSLQDPPKIKLLFTDIARTVCNDTCNGRATVIAQYDSPTSPNGRFTYRWRDGKTDSMRVDLCKGVNQIVVTDSRNCVVQDSILIASPPAVTADSLTSVAVTCFGGRNGQARVQGGGGAGAPFTYRWSSTGNPTTPTLTNLAAGNYSVTIRDKDNCRGVFGVRITQPDSLSVRLDSARSARIACFGEKSGALAVSVTGGNTGTRTYKWTNAQGTQIGNSPILDKIGSGLYTVQVTDPKGCSTTLPNLRLNDPNPVRGAFKPLAELKCNGDNTTLNIDTISGGAGGPYRYSVDFGVQLNRDFPFTLTGGRHYVTYFDRLGCSFTDTITIREPAPIVVTFNPPVIQLELGDSIRLVPTITGAVVDKFTWTPENQLRNPKSLTPSAYTFENATYVLTVFDRNGCGGKGTVRVEVDPNRNMYVPNAFIPGNPTGLNDYFAPKTGRSVEKINYFQVFNRWGELLYEKKDFLPENDNFSDGWDGMYRGKFVDPGVYIYIAEVRFLDGRVLLYRGDVTVLR